MPISVFIADDNERVRKVVVSLLQVAPVIEIVGEASCFAQTLQLASKIHPGVIVLDIHMGDEHSMTPAQLKSSLISSCLLAMSIWTDDETRSLAEAIGAIKLLDKSTLGIDLIPAIRDCANVQNRDQAPKCRGASASD